MYYVDENIFVGTWQLEGRNIYHQMTISIVKEGDKLRGYVLSPPNNKYGQLFLEQGDPWILEISRSSNYYFKITEGKIASELFKIYGLDTTSNFYVTFSEDHNRFYLSVDTPHKIANETSIYYERLDDNFEKAVE